MVSHDDRNGDEMELMIKCDSHPIPLRMANQFMVSL